MLTEGRLILEFTFDDLMRIRMWHFAARQHCELIPRGIIAGLQVTAIGSYFNSRNSAAFSVCKTLQRYGNGNGNGRCEFI